MNRQEIRERLKKKGVDGFQLEVLMATYDIPKGKTATYKQIAQRIGRPNAYRAVGTALKNNPMAPIVPCHRVVKSDGSLGNYSAPGGTSKKRLILKSEGAI